MILKKLSTTINKFKPEIVFHLAASQVSVRSNSKKGLGAVSENLILTTSLIEACLKNNIKNFIFTSSCSVYGTSTESPPFNENVEIVWPLSTYGNSKRSCELLFKAYHETHGINVKILRFFSAYGPWNRPDMAIYSFTDKVVNQIPIQIFNNGDHRRDFTYVSDIVDGIIASLNDTKGYNIFNLGSDKPISLKNLIGSIESRLNKKAVKEYLPLQEGDVSVTHASITKSQRILGYNPKVSFKIGLEKFIDWYLSHNGESKKL